jgi:hypothetical protein
MTDSKEASVLIRISKDGSDYELFSAALIYEGGRPFAVEPDPADRTPQSAKIGLDPKLLEEQPNDDDGTRVFVYRATILLPRLT